ncbi:rCG42102 [Rattus norvegicus]|uniref:RCG42102 n=1 Tax=Rattus norvegicus TaxID=10116 RepID=A6JV16_RAT|nr:rCG42102 [Rattus norvegicus]
MMMKAFVKEDPEECDLRENFGKCGKNETIQVWKTGRVERIW